VFTSVPKWLISSLIATKDKEFPVIQTAVKAQTIPIGMTDNTMIVLLKVLKSKIKIETKRKTVTMVTISDWEKSKNLIF
jgi:hypothetical protein